MIHNSMYCFILLALLRLFIVTTAVYPHLVDFTGKLNFAVKVDPLNLDFDLDLEGVHEL